MNNQIVKYPGGEVPKMNVMSFDTDAQRGFTPLCPDELPVPDGHNIADELNKQARFAETRGYSKDSHAKSAEWVANEEHPQFDRIEDTPDMDLRWNMHCAVGERGHELIDGLPHPREYQIQIHKGVERDMHPYGACYHDHAKQISTGLIEQAKVRGIKVIIVGGLALDYCVAETVREMLAAGFIVILNLAATRAISEEGGKVAVEELRNKGAIIIRSATELKLIDADVA